MSEFLMPSLGADMEAGTLIQWLVKPGDQVKHGDVIAVIETQKGAIEIEIFEDGVLEAYLIDIGKKVPVGTPLASIRQTGEKKTKVSIAPPELPDVAPETEKGGRLEEDFTKRKLAVPEKGKRFLITPAARRRTKELGLDMVRLEGRGSGPDGAITLADVEAQIGKKLDVSATAAGGAAPIEMTGMRGAIAAAMSRSKREIPHYYLAHTIDLSKVNSFVTQTNANRPPSDRLLPSVLYAKAVACAVEKYPEFNGHFIDGNFHKSKVVHIGTAINIRGGGLVAPAIHNIESLDLDAIMSAMRDLVSRVRAGRFRSSELSDSTITISSLGERGVDTLFGIIYPPQVAIIGFGTPSERPWVCGEKLEIRRLVTITLAADHRVSDGHRGALFLNAIDNFLQEPETL